MKPRKLKRVTIKEELVALTGNYVCALILNQFIYWSERTDDTDEFLREERTRNPELDIEPLHGWVYKKADALIEELMLDVSGTTIRRYITKLVDLKLLLERYNPKRKYDRTMQYRPNIVEIQKQLQVIGYALEGYPLYLARSLNLQNEECILHDAECKPQNEESNLQNEEWNLQNEAAIPEITTEITTEITSLNIESEGKKIEQEEDKPPPVVSESKSESRQPKRCLTRAKPVRKSVAKPINSDEDQPSAAPQDLITKSNFITGSSSTPTPSKRVDGSVTLPWDLPETHPKRGKEFDPGFEEHMARSLRICDKYQGLTKSHFTIQVRKHISRGRHDQERREALLIEWEGYQELLAKEQERLHSLAQAEEQEQKRKELPYEIPFSLQPYSKQQQWADEFVLIGEEAFKQKYSWYEDWYYYLGHSSSHLKSLLVQIGKAPETSTTNLDSSIKEQLHGIRTKLKFKS